MGEYVCVPCTQFHLPDRKRAIEAGTAGTAPTGQCTPADLDQIYGLVPPEIVMSKTPQREAFWGYDVRPGEPDP